MKVAAEITRRRNRIRRRLPASSPTIPAGVTDTSAAILRVADERHHIFVAFSVRQIQIQFPPYGVKRDVLVIAPVDLERVGDRVDDHQSASAFGVIG